MVKSMGLLKTGVRERATGMDGICHWRCQVPTGNVWKLLCSFLGDSEAMPHFDPVKLADNGLLVHAWWSCMVDECRKKVGVETM